MTYSKLRSDQMNLIDQLWDYSNPAGSEPKFRALLTDASDDVTFHVAIMTQIARTQSLRQLFDEAHATLDEVKPLLDKAEPIARIRYQLERGRSFRSAGDPKSARPLFLNAWNSGTLIGADFYAIDAAHMMGIIGNEQEQIDWNERALAAAEASTDQRASNWRGSLYNNLGWTYHSMDAFGQALDLFERQLDFFTALNKPERIRIASWCVARCYRSLGRIDEALAMQAAQRALYESLGEESGYVFEEIGECLLLLNRPEEAAPNFAKAFALLSQDMWLQKNEADRLDRLQKLGQTA